MQAIDRRDSPPLSHAIVHNGTVHVSGQVGFKPGTTEVIAADIEAQCRQTFAHIDRILEQAGSSRRNIIRCTVYLTNVQRDFPVMNRCYAEWLGDQRPARTTIGVALALPELLVEMDCIAAVEQP